MIIILNIFLDYVLVGPNAIMIGTHRYTNVYYMHIYLHIHNIDEMRSNNLQNRVWDWHAHAHAPADVHLGMLHRGDDVPMDDEC